MVGEEFAEHLLAASVAVRFGRVEEGDTLFMASFDDASVSPTPVIPTDLADTNDAARMLRLADEHDRGDVAANLHTFSDELRARVVARPLTLRVLSPEAGRFKQPLGLRAIAAGCAQGRSYCGDVLFHHSTGYTTMAA